jgi:multidrug efflux pump subunit AcrB
MLFLLASLLPLLRLVPLKLLPFDNKSEIQVLIDMPEGTSLEATAAEANRIASITKQLPEIKALAVFVGRPSPDDFNGLVRRYQQRAAPYQADLRLTLVKKEDRVHQSHAIVLRLRHLLNESSSRADIKIIEVPPGPPVMDTLVAEIYADRTTPYSSLLLAAAEVQARLQKEPLVVQIDSTVQDTQHVIRFITDKEKAALSGISVHDINQSLRIANAGAVIGYMNFSRESVPLPIRMRLTRQERSSQSDLNRLQVGSQIDILKQRQHAGLLDAPQSLVSIGELGQFETRIVDQAIYHKDLRPLVYVTAELSGRTPAEVIADVSSDFESRDTPPTDWRSRNYLDPGGGVSWRLPRGTEVKWSGEGEWKITLRVFRDMGLGFLFALIAIFVVLSLQTGSTSLSLIIMSSIPLTIIGIMPGFWLLNHLGEREIAGAPDPVLFTATAMIGMIALAGIVVRNSLILIQFIEQASRAGSELKEALLMAGAVRMRPVLLTAGTTLLGNIIITLDPVFSGLAVAIIFGILSSTLLTLVVVPVVYYLVFDQSRQTTAEATIP